MIYLRLSIYTIYTSTLTFDNNIFKRGSEVGVFANSKKSKKVGPNLMTEVIIRKQ